jgi:hypothetical protein
MKKLITSELRLLRELIILGFVLWPIGYGRKIVPRGDLRAQGILICLTLILVLLMATAILRWARGTDEYVRQRLTNTSAATAVLSALLGTVYVIVRQLGLPKASLIQGLFAMGLVYVFVASSLGLRDVILLYASPDAGAESRLRWIQGIKLSIFALGAWGYIYFVAIVIAGWPYMRAMLPLSAALLIGLAAVGGYYVIRRK